MVQIMAKHLIYDFETVANGCKTPNAACPSLAVNVFDPSEDKSFDELVANTIRFKFKLSEQFTKYGRISDEDTVGWWKKPENAKAYAMVIEPSSEDISLSELGPLLQAYLNDQGYDAGDDKSTVWTRGNSFDVPILSNIYAYFGWDEPYPWWRVRDVRTEIDAIVPYWDKNHAGYGYIKGFPYPDNFIKHKEEHDCARDILMLQHAHLGMQEMLSRLNNDESQQWDLSAMKV